MKAIIEIDMDGAAFGKSDYEQDAEVARMLRKLAADLDGGVDCAGTLADTNGNTCGRFEIVD